MEEKRDNFENMENKEGTDEKRETASQPVMNPAILEAFDGDLDDLISWSSKVAEMERSEKEAALEEEDDGIERQITADGRVVEWFNIRAEKETPADGGIAEEDKKAENPDKQEPFHMEVQPNIEVQVHTGMQSGGSVQLDKGVQSGVEMQSGGGVQLGKGVQSGVEMQSGGSVQLDKGVQSGGGVQLGKGVQSDINMQNGDTEQLHRIDPNDPHYVNYVPDMYYEYGVGPEPQMPSKREMSGGTSGMAIASMCCGIGSIALFCCNYGFPQSIVGLVLGIIVLARKRPFDSSKVMALVGVSLSGLTILIWLGVLVWGIIVSIY